MDVSEEEPHLCSEEGRSEGTRRQSWTVEGDGSNVAPCEQQGWGGDLQSFGLFTFRWESISLVITTTRRTISVTAAALLRRLQGSFSVPRGEVERLTALVRELVLFLLLGCGTPASSGPRGFGVGGGWGVEFGYPGGDVGLGLGRGWGAPLTDICAKADDGARLILSLSQGTQQLWLVLQGADAEGGVQT